jgi:hypothetical protein
MTALMALTGKRSQRLILNQSGKEGTGFMSFDSYAIYGSENHVLLLLSTSVSSIA